ncbi:Brahma associated protein 170kD [Nesidiocoris tenuis]|uniref:Brahma associated protein 170kD n=1 Tax=Nesidiocoris tenuis TaxID=355587 RepID=A0ABN7AI10_9HEMI|nr:Brahma associated protein 170kD [Nesidiocoris tenuis]
MAQNKEIVETEDTEKERDRFLQELSQFHETRGTASKRPPHVHGHEVDLHKLYTLVTNRGGWVKVNTKNEWDQITGDFDIPPKCLNAGVAIKQIYLRYLDRYEKIHYMGEIGERGGVDEDEDSRHRRWSTKNLHAVPLTYNHGQHNVNESLREYNGLSVNLYKPSEFEKLSHSLMSPLPNEQDFAINICTLLSNEGKHCLRLDKCPRFLHALLAHAAVFSNSRYRVLFCEMYARDRGHCLDTIWEDTVQDPNVLRLADETNFSDIPRDRIPSPDPCVNPTLGYQLEPEDNELFSLGRTLGIQDYVGQRICQIATIVRNLTFVTDNVPVMGADLTFLRFALLCCSCNYNGLQQMGWDMLANVAAEITVQSPLIDDIVLTTTKGLLSEDRAVILSSLEVLNKLAQCEKNEELLLRTLSQDVYCRVCSFLSLHDIMLLVYTLECLNAISSLGEKACNCIFRVRGALDVLVSLITVEAQSYGPKACIQMRVVETVSGNSTGVVCPTASSGSTTLTATVSSSSTTPTINSSSTVSVTSSSAALSLATHSSSTASSSTTPLTNVSTTNLTSAVPTTQHDLHVTTSQKPIQYPSPRSSQLAAAKESKDSSTNSAHATQQVAQENEQFALAWLRNTFEPVTLGRVEQAELYKQYINYCAKIGRRGVIAPLHFPRCVRSVFGGSVGPKPTTTGDTTHHYYEGINLRAKPIQTVVSSSPTTTLSTLVPSTPSPILKAQLSAPPKPTPSNTQSTKVTQRQQQQRLLQRQNTPQAATAPAQAPVVTPLKPIVADDSNNKAIGTQMSQFSNKTTLNYNKVNGIRASNETVAEKSDSINGQGAFAAATEGSSNFLRLPTLASLAPKTNSSQLTASVTTVVNDETGSTSNSVASLGSSLGIRDSCSITGGDEGENSMSSLDGFLLNGIPSSLDLDDANSKDSLPKSLMFADLLEKSVTERTEAPVLNGSLRIVDKGLEFVRNRVDDKTNIQCAVKNSINGIDSEPAKISNSALKRPSSDSDTSDQLPIKKPHLNGDIKEETIKEEPSEIKEEAQEIKEETKDVKEEPPEEGNVSSTAANLYAALAADALEDEPLEELQQQQPQQPLLLASTPSRQILVAAGGQLTQRVVVGGQHYVVAQPQTALVQGQTQTVLVAQTPQQQGTGAKTIIILQPQNVGGTVGAGAVASPAQQKVIVQRLQSPPPAATPSPQPPTPPPLIAPGNSQQQQHQTIGVAPAPVKATTPAKPSSTPIVPPQPTVQAGAHLASANRFLKSTKVTGLSSAASSQTVLCNVQATSVTVSGGATTTTASEQVANSSSIATVYAASPPIVTSKLAATVATSQPSSNNTITLHAAPQVTPKPAEPQAHFLCEWRGCMKSFRSGNEVYMHAVEAHCPHGSQEIQCLWERCDAMKRKRLSLMTHLQDKHCNADVMRMMAVRRKQLSVTGRSEIPAPIPAVPHPGYAPNAAFHAIKRHALEFVNPKELQQQRAAKPGPTPAPVQAEQDDNEGPVTKSIRLTAALILRNLVIFSTNGRRHLTRFEPHLASVALSNVESSRTIAHVLFDMNQPR